MMSTRVYFFVTFAYVEKTKKFIGRDPFLYFTEWQQWMRNIASNKTFFICIHMSRVG